MALIEHDLFGNVVDKEDKAVQIAKMFEPPEGFYLAYSGGKDSAAAKKILDIAGVMYDPYYNVTTVDPPELVRHIIRQFKAVIYEFTSAPPRFFRTDGCSLIKCDEADLPKDRRQIIHFNIPEYPMRKLIVKKKFPPTRLQRYCCEVLKESHGVGRVVVTGVRKHESAARKENQGDVVIFSGKRAAQKMDANFTLTKRGGWCSITTIQKRIA